MIRDNVYQFLRRILQGNVYETAKERNLLIIVTNKVLHRKREVLTDDQSAMQVVYRGMQITLTSVRSVCLCVILQVPYYRY